MPSGCPWQQDLHRPMDPLLIYGSLAGVTLLGTNSVHHSLAPSSVASSAVDSFSDFGTFISPGVFQSCKRELGASLQLTQIKTEHGGPLHTFENSACLSLYFRSGHKRGVYKDMRISIALLLSFPAPSQCQFTLAHPFPASFYSIYGIAVEVAPSSSIVLAGIPHFPSCSQLPHNQC